MKEFSNVRNQEASPKFLGFNWSWRGVRRELEGDEERGF